MAVRRSCSKTVVLLGTGAGGGGKKGHSEDGKRVEDMDGRDALIVNDKDGRCALREGEDDRSKGEADASCSREGLVTADSFRGVAACERASESG